MSYDAGACSLDNAALVRELGLHYLFGLTGAQPTLLDEAKRQLGTRTAEHAAAHSEDVSRAERVVRRLYLTEEMSGFGSWQQLRTVLRVESETFDVAGRRVAYEERYFLASLPSSRLSPEQWLLLLRLHWGVETAHQILDVAFAEDGHPWIESVPRAAVVVAILRRIACDLLTLFRSVTQRADTSRQRPWRSLMRPAPRPQPPLRQQPVSRPAPANLAPRWPARPVGRRRSPRRPPIRAACSPRKRRTSRAMG